MINATELQAHLGHAGFDPGPRDGRFGSLTLAALMAYLVRRPNGQFLDLARPLNHWFVGGLIDNRLRVIHFLAHASVESQGFTRMVENLNYSAERLHEVWPHRFPTLAAAAPYAHNPEALANKTYGGRLGNDDAGDGWRYRGRGIFQLTGEANYHEFGEAIGVDLMNNPDLAATPAIAAAVACIFWLRRRMNVVADQDNVIAGTELLNGGHTGLTDREANVLRLKQVWPE